MFTIILQVSALALLTAFVAVYGSKLLDLCMDYPNIWWRWRYTLARRAARKSAGDLEKELVQALAKADEVNKAGILLPGEDQPVQIMANVYHRIAAHYPRFKRWVCIYCMTVFLGLVLVSGAIVVVVWPVYGLWAGWYFFASFAGISFLLRI